MENDGYEAIQVGFVDQKEKLANKPKKGHFEKAGVSLKKYLKEFRFEDATNYEIGAEIKAMLRGMDNNIYVQIGMLLLIAMSSKNALILVLYARRYGEQGMTAMQAAHKAASVRFRPILMSSLAYAVGALPMLWATGAGAINQQYLGTAVFGGMVATALLTVLYAPFFYAVFMGLSSKLGGKRTPEPKQA